MIFQDGQAFKDMDGDVRAPNVLDNLIYRREIPVMIAVFINPGRTPEQPEPTPRNWGDRDTNRPTEYNSLDDRYARVIVDELMPVLYKEYNISKDPDRHGIGGASSGAIAAFTVAWQRPERLPQGAEHRRQLHEPARRRRLRRHRAARARRSRSGSFCRTAATTIAASGRGGIYDQRARLVLPERAADAGAHREGLRRELHVGHQHATASAWAGRFCRR